MLSINPDWPITDQLDKLRYNGMIFSNLCEPTERQMTLICNSLSLFPVPNISEIYWEVRKSICLSKWNGTFQSNWPNQSKWTTYTGDPKHSICTKSKWMFPFDFWPKFLELLVKWNAPIQGDTPYNQTPVVSPCETLYSNVQVHY